MFRYRRIASILQRERQEQVLKDMVSRITQDGTTTINAKIPPELRGTLLGHQVMTDSHAPRLKFYLGCQTTETTTKPSEENGQTPTFGAKDEQEREY
mmetsp:Transcript_10933/g.36926  ORF Transcript_10933/g.36926 Transcript_10933/m.36926 type:complete len:97 (+) Transcript_10933:1709-1999(+)